MSDNQVFLYPLLAFLVLGALGALWQARNPQREVDARRRLLEGNVHLSRWQAMPQWRAYCTQQDDPVRLARTARRRAALLGVAAAATAAALALGA